MLSDELKVAFFQALERGDGNPTVAALVATAGVLGLRVSVA